MVYVGISIYFFSAFIGIRLWTMVAGKKLNEVQGRRLEIFCSLAAMLVPIIPALLISVPQVLFGVQGANPQLSRCSQGYISFWQIIAAGLVFTVPPTLVSLCTMVAIMYTVSSLLRNSHFSAVQRKAALALAFRVVFLSLAVGVHEVYYVLADIFRLLEVDFFDAIGSVHENIIGHYLLATWGSLFFLVFGTTHQSLAALHVIEKKNIVVTDDDGY